MILKLEQNAFQRRAQTIKKYLLFILLFLTGQALAGSGTDSTRTDYLPDFTLKDANDRAFHLAEHQGEIMVLSFIPDTKDKKQGAHWLDVSRQCLQHLRQKFGDSLFVLGIKEMTDLPFFLPRSFIKAKLRQEPVRYLIDWRGELFDRLAVGGAPLLVVVDSSGKIALRKPLPDRQEAWNALCSNIMALIDQQWQPKKPGKQP